MLVCLFVSYLHFIRNKSPVILFISVLCRSPKPKHFALLWSKSINRCQNTKINIFWNFVYCKNAKYFCHFNQWLFWVVHYFGGLNKVYEELSHQNCHNSEGIRKPVSFWIPVARSPISNCLCQYFNQWTGALQAVHWLNSPFGVF